MPRCVARCRYRKSRWWPVVASGGRERRGIPFARVRRHTAATRSHLTDCSSTQFQGTISDFL